ncbi:MAG: lytic transglycosylase domain-containing protein [Pseudomonadota bacterium]|nr:lytic transglycosylase domain-containing protein [Pseudomonadota bacterium]
MRKKKLPIKQAIATIFVAVTLTAAWQPASAEIYAYVTPQGHKLYTDQIMDQAGYRPANAAARTAKRRGRTSAAAIPPEVRARIDGIIERLAPSYALEPELVKAVVRVESSYRADAVSSKNAQGLMQLIPATQKRFGVENPWDPEQNLRGGMTYLSWLMGQFEGQVPLVLAAYNAGENAVVKYNGIPPFAETRAYVGKVRRHYAKERHPYVKLAENDI